MNKPLTLAATDAMTHWAMALPPGVDEMLSRCENEPTLAAILATVSEVCRVGPHELISHRRDRYLIRARMIYYVVARLLTSKSYPQIGRHCDGRDHTTVMHAVRCASADLASLEPQFGAVVRRIAERGASCG